MHRMLKVITRHLAMFSPQSRKHIVAAFCRLSDFNRKMKSAQLRPKRNFGWTIWLQGCFVGDLLKHAKHPFTAKINALCCLCASRMCGVTRTVFHPRAATRNVCEPKQTNSLQNLHRQCDKKIKKVGPAWLHVCGHCSRRVRMAEETNPNQNTQMKSYTVYLEDSLIRLLCLKGVHICWKGVHTHWLAFVYNSL